MKTILDLGIKAKGKVFTIAEIGINHGGDINIAKKLIDSAVNAGADAVKFQTYVTEKRVPKDSPIFTILKNCELSFVAFKELKEYSDAKGVTFFSTPFDEESVDYLESIKVELYKIASFDVVNNVLLKKIASTGKPVILSVGMSTINEINNAVDLLKMSTNKIALLHCISAYPTFEEDANLAAVHTLTHLFPDCVIGQSDHTTGIDVPLYAVAAGAQILEKHYKISADMDCIDAAVSISEEQFSKMVDDVRRLEKILGKGVPEATLAQEAIKQYRRFKD
jgi:N,N'-diacetyllegionaminate synthase